MTGKKKRAHNEKAGERESTGERKTQIEKEKQRKVENSSFTTKTGSPTKTGSLCRKLTKTDSPTIRIFCLSLFLKNSEFLHASAVVRLQNKTILTCSRCV